MVVPRDETGFVSRFGTLEGLDSVPPARRVEFLPYVAANADVQSAPDPNDPFAGKSEGSARVGGDFKVGLGKGLVLDGTVNPDFAQVEADPAQLNLTAFETIYPERRPFFTEAHQYIEGPIGNFFYSRRVGAPPRGEVSTAYVDSPTSPRSWARPSSPAGSAAPPRSARSRRSPSARWPAPSTPAPDTTTRARSSRPARTASSGCSASSAEAQSTVGLSMSGMRRFFSDGSSLESEFSRQAFAAGTDWYVRFQGGRYVFSGLGRPQPGRGIRRPRST